MTATERAELNKFILSSIERIDRVLVTDAFENMRVHGVDATEKLATIVLGHIVILEHKMKSDNVDEGKLIDELKYALKYSTNMWEYKIEDAIDEEGNETLRENISKLFPVGNIVVDYISDMLKVVLRYAEEEDKQHLSNIAAVLNNNMLEDEDFAIYDGTGWQPNRFKQMKRNFLVSHRINDARTMEDITDILLKCLNPDKLAEVIYCYILKADTFIAQYKQENK